MRLRVTLAYNGAAWQGWQWQKPPAPTIQGELERALGALTGCRCRVVGAGRTDSGVHALGQVAHVDVPDMQRDWRHQLNAVLSRDISVLAVEEVSPLFHARKDAVAKTYFYNFWPEIAFMDPRKRAFVWSCGPLNVDAMAEAAALFLGEHDFASFQNSGTPVKSTLRKILAIRLDSLPRDAFLPACAPPLRLVVQGTGFLKQMVRNMAGFLVAVGRNKLKAQELPHILAAAHRSALAAPTAPALGLFLAKVHYAEDVHVPQD